MRLVCSLMAVEVHFAVAAAAFCRRFARSRFRLDALHRCPGPDERAVDREVIGGQERLHLSLRQNCTQELRSDVAFRQSVAVFGEGRVVPRLIVDADADEPAEQEIVFQPLH